jgi:hypothetical protein
MFVVKTEWQEAFPEFSLPYLFVKISHTYFWQTNHYTKVFHVLLESVLVHRFTRRFIKYVIDFCVYFKSWTQMGRVFDPQTQ